MEADLLGELADITVPVENLQCLGVGDDHAVNCDPEWMHVLCKDTVGAAGALGPDLCGGGTADSRAAGWRTFAVDLAALRVRG